MGCTVGLSQTALAATGPIFATSLAAIIFILALVFMFSQLFRKPEWEGAVKMELYQVVVSVIIFISIYALVGFSCEISQGFNSGVDYFTTAQNYLNLMIYRVTIPELFKLETLATLMQYAGNMISKYGAGAWGYNFPLFPGAPIIEAAVNFVVFVISPFTASLMVQVLILQAIQGIALTIMLPAGVLLRVFTPTRDAGSFLIASAFAFYVIYPMTYVMHANVMDYVISNSSSLTWKQEFNQYISGQNVNGIQTAPASPQSQQQLLDLVFLRGLLDLDLLFQPLESLSYTILAAIFLPALSMIITTTFIKGTSKFLSQKLE
ncbi:MAG: hypothetical protein WC506_06005 [Candidatus Micrarchaeia archaeon]